MILVNFKKINPKSVWVIPLGNRVKRNIDIKEQIIELNVIKITNKMIFVDNIFTTKFHIDGTFDNHNNGYLPFLTKQDALNYLEGGQIIQKIKHTYDLRRLTYENLKMIESLFDKE